MNVTPIVNKATATYLSLHVINANPTTKIAGNKFPKTLNSFLVCVLVNVFFRISISATAPDMLIFSQNIRYGNDERRPFYRKGIYIMSFIANVNALADLMSNRKTSAIYFGIDVRNVYVPQLLQVCTTNSAQQARDVRIAFHGASNSFLL